MVRTTRWYSALLPLIMVLGGCGDDPSGPDDVPDPGVDDEGPTSVISSPAAGTTATAGGVLVFDGSTSEDPAGRGLAYTWDFDDGSRGGVSTLAHAFPRAGSYGVFLIVTDVEGVADTAAVTVDVNAPSPTTETGQVVGTVVDETGAPLSGAQVLLDGTAVGSSDGEGAVEIADLPTGIPLGLQVALDGYSSEVVRLTIDPDVGVGSFRAGLRPRNAPQTLDSDAGGTATGEDGVAITLPPGGLVDEAGNRVGGQVEIAMTPVDVSGPERAAFPGAFAGVGADGVEDPIVSFGVAEFVLSQGGQELQLAPGAAAELTIPIYTTGAAEGDRIPLWSLDEATGIWIQEGEGEVIASGDGLALRGEVGHLSWWNVDKEIDVIEVYFSCEGFVAAKGVPVDICRISQNSDDDGPAFQASSVAPEAGFFEFVPASRRMRFVADAVAPECFLQGETVLDIPSEDLPDPVVLELTCREGGETNRIDYGYDQTGTFSEPGLAEFIWAGATGEEIRIDVLAAQYAVYAPDGTLLVQQSAWGSTLNTDRIFFNLEQDGDYRIQLARDSRANSDGYGLTLLRYEPRPPVELGNLTTPVVLGDTLDFPSEEDVFRFDGVEGAPVAYSATRNFPSRENLSADLEVRGPDGTVLRTELVGGSGIVGEWFRLPASGTYEVRLRSRSENGLPGEYTLRLEPVTPGTLAPGGTVTGTVEDPLRIEPYGISFDGAAEARLRVAVAPDAGFLLFTLLGPDDTPIYRERWSSGVEDYFFFQVPTDLVGREYRLQVHGLSVVRVFGNPLRDRGGYTAELDVYTPEDPVPLAYGDSVDGELGFFSEVDVYTFQGAEGDQLRLTTGVLEGATLSGLVTLIAPSGTTVVEDLTFRPAAPAGTDQVLTEAGTYRIEIRPQPGTGGLPGGYRVQLEDTGAPVPTTVGSRLEGAIDFSGEVDEYLLDGTAGQWVVVSAGADIGSDLSGTVQLLGPDGSDVLQTDFTSPLEFTSTAGLSTRSAQLPTTGEYRLVMSGSSSFTSGGYVVFLGNGVGRQDMSYGGQLSSAYLGFGGEFEDAALAGDAPVIIDSRTDVVKFDATGNPDVAFGGDGRIVLTEAFQTSLTLLASVVDVLPDGRILVAGHTGTTDARLFAGRLNTDGTPDATFGTGGLTVIETGGRVPWLNEARLIDTGSGFHLLVAGWTGASAFSRDEVFLARLGDDGAPVTTFGGGDGLVVDPADISVRYVAMDLQSDGRIVVASTNVRRYLADGSLDTSFGTGGVADLSGLPPTEGVVVLPDDRIVVVGDQADGGGARDVVAVRLLADGARDAAFGDGGVALLDAGFDEFGNTLAVEAGGNVVLGGSIRPSSEDSSYTLLVRLAEDGTAATAFGAQGLAIGEGFNAPALWMQADSQNRIMVGVRYGVIRFIQ